MIFAYIWDWKVVAQNFPALLDGFGLTLELTFVCIWVGMILGVFVALGRLSRYPFINKPILAYIEFFRGTPALVQLVWIYYALPILLGISFPSFLAVVLALGLNLSAFAGEAIRSGIQAIPREQVEAADVLGLNYGYKMRYVIIPQAIRIVIPVLLSLSISLFKDTSLVSVLGVTDLMYNGNMVSTTTYRPLEVLTTVAIMYFIIAFPATMVLRTLELRLAKRLAV